MNDDNKNDKEKRSTKNDNKDLSSLSEIDKDEENKQYDQQKQEKRNTTDGSKEDYILTHSEDSQIQSNSSLTRKFNSLIPKFKTHNKLEPMNIPFDLSSLNQTFDNFKTKVKFQSKNTFLKKSKTANQTNDIHQDHDDPKILTSSEENRVVDVDTDNQPVINSDIDFFQEQRKYKKGKIIFAAPQQPGDPFIPIPTYYESTGKPPNEINENKSTCSSVNHLNFEIIWRNLVYYPQNAPAQNSDKQVDVSTKVAKRPHRAILNNISGIFRSGQMTGIIGPSGSGKTILLNCIAGLQPINVHKENSGEILVNGVNSIRIGFVEQSDHLYEYLTVRETLMFSSMIRNAARYYLNHEKVVKNVMDRLDLSECAKNRISECSNGQRKRISIAVELVFNSDILMLDEPTTGVDSVSGFQIMNNLKSLTKRRRTIAILATIHQPSARIFTLFDNLIILSYQGTIIFEGHPSDLPKTFQLVGLSCPMYTSISDYSLEVASGDFGRQSLHLLTHYNNEYNRNRFTEDFNEIEMCSLREAIKCAHLSDQRSILLYTWLVLWRSMICTYRNPFSLKIRVSSLVGIALFLGLIYTDTVGQISTCATKYFLWNTKLEELIDKIEEHSLRSRENVSVLFLILLVSLFNSMLNLTLTIPSEIYVFRHEYNNYSYTILTYFITKIISELPFTITTIACFVWAVHRITGQIFDDWNRLYLTILPCCLVTLVGQFIGMILGVIFYHNQIQAIFSLTFLLIPMMLCSGYFKLIKNMNSFMATISYISFMKPALNSLLIIIYGVDRCLNQLNEEFKEVQQLNKTRPEWIDSLALLIDYQNSLSNSSILVPKENQTMENEDRLILFMGLSKENSKNIQASILQYMDLGSTLDNYWNEIIQLISYNAILCFLLYVTMRLRLKRQRN